MEKQASKLNQQNSNIFKAIIFTFLLTLAALPTKAQVLNDSTAVVKKDTITVQKNIVYEKGKEYTLGGISIIGLQKFTESTVKVFTGLKIGQPLKLPGDKLTSAIKKLYESKQFSTVDVYLIRVDGNTIYLEFAVYKFEEIENVITSDEDMENMEEENTMSPQTYTSQLIQLQYGTLLGLPR